MQTLTTTVALAVLGSAGALVIAAPVQEGTPKPAPQKQEAEKAAPKVSGTVSFEGDLPEPKELKVEKKAAEGCCPDGESVDKTDLSLVISKDRGIANVVVTAKVEGVRVKISEEPYVVDQKGCRFLPHVRVVPKGAKVAFLNSDETSHNVRLVTLLNDPLNQTVLAGKELVRKFDEVENIQVKCDMHTWMSAHVVVTDATHWAVTDEDGAFSLVGLPPGEHEVTFWHETLGNKTAKVKVGDDGAAEPIEVTMAKKKKKSRKRRR